MHFGIVKLAVPGSLPGFGTQPLESSQHLQGQDYPSEDAETGDNELAKSTAREWWARAPNQIWLPLATVP